MQKLLKNILHFTKRRKKNVINYYELGYNDGRYSGIYNGFFGSILNDREYNRGYYNGNHYRKPSELEVMLYERFAN